MKKTMYGAEYEPIATEDAKKDIANDTFTHINYESKEVGWWQVATMDNGDEMWMNNSDGVIFIITKGDTSYWRYF